MVPLLDRRVPFEWRGTLRAALSQCGSSAAIDSLARVRHVLACLRLRQGSDSDLLRELRSTCGWSPGAVFDATMLEALFLARLTSECVDSDANDFLDFFEAVAGSKDEGIIAQLLEDTRSTLGIKTVLDKSGTSPVRSTVLSLTPLDADCRSLTSDSRVALAAHTVQAATAALGGIDFLDLSGQPGIIGTPRSVDYDMPPVPATDCVLPKHATVMFKRASVDHHGALSSRPSAMAITAAAPGGPSKPKHSSTTSSCSGLSSQPPTSLAEDGGSVSDEYESESHALRLESLRIMDDHAERLARIASRARCTTPFELTEATTVVRSSGAVAERSLSAARAVRCRGTVPSMVKRAARENEKLLQELGPLIDVQLRKLTATTALKARTPRSSALPHAAVAESNVPTADAPISAPPPQPSVFSAHRTGSENVRRRPLELRHRERTLRKAENHFVESIASVLRSTDGNYRSAPDTSPSHIRLQRIKVEAANRTRRRLKMMTPDSSVKADTRAKRTTAVEHTATLLQRYHVNGKSPPQ